MNIRNRRGPVQYEGKMKSGLAGGQAHQGSQTAFFDDESGSFAKN